MISVTAVPPFQTSSLDDGLQISYMKSEAYVKGSEPRFNAHVYNSSGFWLSNSSSGCVIHVYGINGEHIVNSLMTFDVISGDFYYQANSSITSNIGYYPYNIYCNSTNKYGWVSGGYYVSNSGRFVESIGSNWLAICVIFILMCAIFFYASFIIKNKELQMVKILFFVYGVVNLFLVVLLPYIISLNPNDLSVFELFAEGYVIVNGIGLIAFVFMYGYHLIINIGDSSRKKENE